jgi:hypothetical protein
VRASGRLAIADAGAERQPGHATMLGWLMSVLI